MVDGSFAQYTAPPPTNGSTYFMCVGINGKIFGSNDCLPPQYDTGGLSYTRTFGRFSFFMKKRFSQNIIFNKNLY